MVVDVLNKTSRMELPVQRVYLGPASVIKRLLAFLVDVVLLDVVILLPFGGIIERVMPFWSFGTAMIVPTFSLLLLLYGMSIVIFLYFVLFEHYLLQTPGKMLFGLFVVKVSQKDAAPERVTLEQAVVRSLQTMPIIPFIFLWFIDPVFVLLSRNGQRMLERWSQSLVVERYAL